MALDFTEKLGPLPVWGWGLIGGGVIVVGYYLFNRGGSAATDSTVVYTDATGYRTSGNPGVDAGSTPDGYGETNALWLTRASRQVAEMSAASVTDVYNALKKFLAGETLTEKERGYVDTATKTVGLPPEGVEGISPVTPSPGTPTTTPKRFPTTNTQWIVTTSNAAKKYLYDSTQGKIVNPSGYNVAAWAALRGLYGNNIDVRIVSAANIKSWGGK